MPGLSMTCVDPWPQHEAEIYGLSMKYVDTWPQYEKHGFIASV